MKKPSSINNFETRTDIWFTFYQKERNINKGLKITIVSDIAYRSDDTQIIHYFS